MSFRINDQIGAKNVRLVDGIQDKSLLGVMPTHRALALAQKEGLDLVEVVRKADPPVCRILDHKKHMYEMKEKQKKQEEEKRSKKKEGR